MPERDATKSATFWTNATVLTMDAQNRRADAIAFGRDGIIAVGTRDEVERYVPNVRAEDLGGAIVLPGFVDAHHHVTLSALWGGQTRLVPPVVRDTPSFLEALRDAAQDLPDGAWLVVTEWDESQLAERRPPTRAELDDAVPDRPLFAIHYTCHRALCNSRALELAGIDRHTPDPPGGRISRDRKGLPDGLLIERAMSRPESLSRADLLDRDAEGFLDRIAAHYRSMVAAGITHVADCAVPIDVVPAIRRSVERGDVLIPTILFPTSSTGYLEEPWDILDGPRTGESFGPVTIGPAKLVFDGAPGCAMCLGWWQSMGLSVRTALLSLQMGSLDPIRTALSLEPRVGTKVRSGIAIYAPDEADRVVDELVANGFGVATHAIGNDAIETALDAYAARGAHLHDVTRARIEHASFIEPEQIARLADLGGAMTAQPAMLAMPGFDASPSVPGLPFFPLRRLLDAGVLAGGSSDYPVTGFDPLVGVRTAISRRSASGLLKDPAEAISLDEALKMFTRDAAETCGVLDQTGTLEVGKRADVVVLSGTLDAPDSLRVERTFVGGIEPL